MKQQTSQRRSTAAAGRRGKHRVTTPKPGYRWLGAGALTLGLGAAMAGGATAHADTGAAEGGSGAPKTTTSSPTKALFPTSHSTAARGGSTADAPSPWLTRAIAHTSTPPAPSNSEQTGHSHRPLLPPPAVHPQPVRPPVSTTATTARSDVATTPFKTIVASTVAPPAIRTSGTTTTHTLTPPVQTSEADLADNQSYSAIESPFTVKVEHVVDTFFGSIEANLAKHHQNPLTDVLEASFLWVRRSLFDQAPTLTPTQTTGQTSGPITGSLGGVDPEGEKISYRVVNQPQDGTVAIDEDNGTYTYTPDPGFDGTDVFTVAATDGKSGLDITDPLRPKAVQANVVVQQGAQQPHISYTFSYIKGADLWSEAARTDLAYSADLLARNFVVTAPVTLTYDVTGALYKKGSTLDGVLASAGSDLISSDPGFYPTVVQKKIQTGVDANGATADGYVTVNFAQPWAYGSPVGADQYDFESTAEHELLHSFGFLSYVQAPDKNTGQTWTTFDSFITDQNGNKVIDPTSYTFDTSYNPNLLRQNGGVYFDGAQAVAAYGAPVPLYTKSGEWSEGSSVSHLDDQTFTSNDPNAKNAKQLMNAATDTGLGVRTLSSTEVGILKDLGYSVVAATPAQSSASVLA